MGWTVGISGDSFGRLLYVSQLVALVLALLFVVLPLDTVGSAVLALLFVLLVAVTVVAVWRRRNDSDGRVHLGVAEDITYDPFADPGQAAKDRWETAVRRLPGSDDERD